VNGIEACPVEVEVNAGYGDTIIVMVGFPDAPGKESWKRMMSLAFSKGLST
jgi:predicted ATPase with chaperone activity